MKILCKFFSIFFLFLLLFACDGKKEVKILVVHSYEETYAPNKFINSVIEKKLDGSKIDASISYFYLDCERYLAPDEIRRCETYLDSIIATGFIPDLVILLDDQATYSILKSGHPLIKRVPVVFSGVSFPNWELLKEFPNVTGLWNKPDYTSTIGMIKELFGNTAIVHLSDKTLLGQQITQSLDSLSNVKNYKRTNMWMGENEKAEGPALIDSAVHINPYIVDYSIRELSGRNALWYISGIDRSSVLLFTKRDLTTYNPLVYNSYPLFSTINEGFGFGQGILGGCIPVLEQDLSDAMLIVSAILSGASIGDISIRKTKNKCLVDWSEMERWGIDLNRIPKEWKIVNIPFWERHAVLFVALVVLIVIGGIGTILFLMRRLSGEIRKTELVQKDLAKKQSILSLAMESGNIFTWQYDSEQKEFMFDQEFFQSLKIPAVPYSISQIYDMIHPEDCADTIAMLKNYVQTEGRKLIFNIRVRFVGEDYSWWEFRCSPVMTKENGEVFIVGLCLSVQEYKDREQELIEARDLAAKAELKESFLANMSHEIRTPLNAIVGFSNLLVMENDFSEEERKQFIDSINKNCEMLLKLINDILEISRIESGNMSFKFEEVSLQGFIDDVYLTHALLMPPDVTLEKRMEEQDILLTTDKIRLNQILTNFINNAAKFTTRGYIRIGYYLETKVRAGKQVRELCIYVEDTGKGISKDQQQLIFNRFYKQDEFAQGTGLGLSICSVVIQRLGGRITLDSEPGKGSRFIVHLPMDDKCKMVGDNALVPNKKEGWQAKSGKPVILVAEDHDSNYLLLKSTLQDEYQIIRVLNGEGAIKTVRLREDIRLILMDVKMIGMNGLEATETIRKEFPHIPVIIQTAYAMEYTRQMAIEAGCSDFMTKPINPVDLKAKVAQFIKK